MKTKEYRLTDICDFQGGTQPPKEEWINEPREGYVRMLQIRDFTQHKAEHIGYVKDTKKLNKCEQDDILIGRYGASVGKILTGLTGAYNVAIIKTIPKEAIISKKYLYYVLTGKGFQDFITSIGSRAAQAGFNKNDLSFFKFHIPISIEDQVAAVKILEKADTLIKDREMSIFLLEKYLKMKFLEMFGDPVKNVKNWDSEPLQQVTVKITDGKHGDCTNEENSGYYFLSAKDLVNGSLKYHDVREITKEDFIEVNKRTRLKTDDILLGNTGASIGKIGIVTDGNLASRTTFQKSISIITVNEKRITPFYLKSYLENNRSLFNKTSNGSAMSNLLLSQIRAFNILIPPLELQLKYNLLNTKISYLKTILISSRDSFIELFKSLSKKALRGELELIEQRIKFELKEELKFSEKSEVTEQNTIDKINKELEEFHINQLHTGAPDEVDYKIRQLEAELKIRGEISFWDEYVKYRLVKGKFKEAFTFDQLWNEISKFPFETTPKYDDISSLLFKWLAEENAFIRQEFNKSTKQIELIVNETSKA